jgi:hypothetical protein
MKTYGGVGVELHAFLTSVVDFNEKHISFDSDFV